MFGSATHPCIPLSARSLRAPRQESRLRIFAGFALCLAACRAGELGAFSVVSMPGWVARRGVAGLLLSIFGQPLAAVAGPGDLDLSSLGAGRKVVDFANVLSSSQESALEKAICVLEEGTPYRFRVFSPPPGRGPENTAQWPRDVKVLREYWAEDAKWDPQSVVVLLANPRFQGRGRTSSNPISFSVASKLTERLQYRIASDTFTKIGNKFGDSGYVAAVGEDGAIVAAALNAIACLRKGVCMQPLPEAEAEALAMGGQMPSLTPDEASALSRARAKK